MPDSKFSVILMDAGRVEILQVFEDLDDALQFMHQAKESDDEFYYRKLWIHIHCVK